MPRYALPLLISCGLLAAVGLWPVQAAEESAVDVQLTSWADAHKLIAAQKGKILVVDMWSTSCVECKKEFPGLVKLHEQYGKQGVVCMSVSLDYAGIKSKPPEFYKERVVKFLTSQRATFTNVLLTDPSDKVYEELNLAAVPAVYVYGRDGQLVKRFDNESIQSDDEAFSYKDVTKLVAQLAAAK